VPALVRVVPLGVIVTVDPTTSMGTCEETLPEVAVIIAVRLIGPSVPPPDENVAVALPTASVVTGVGPILPVLALISITTPDKVALEEFFAVIVIVEDVEPSDFTVGGEATRSREAGVTVVSVLEPVSPPRLPPQAGRKQNRAREINSHIDCENFVLKDFFISFSFVIIEMDEFFKFNG
jgi:hypothetical protein